jgi:MFS family permease
MFSPYRKLFEVPGALRFSIAGSIARLPISMTLLAITFVIVHVKHSYTLAGTVATGASLISTVFSPMWSRYADRLGQRKVLRFTVPFYIIFDIIFLIAISKHAPTYIWMTSIFIAEMFLPNIGGLTRRRWLWVLGEDRVQINTAYSYEALMDEIIFIIGPLVATSAAIFISPAAGMILGFSFMAVGTTLFISQRSTEPAPFKKDSEAKDGFVLAMPVVQTVFLPFIFLGAFFSSTNLSVVGYAQQHHDAPYTGLVLAIWAAGSGIAAIFNGSIKWRLSDASRFRINLGGILILSLPFFFIHSMLILAIALFLSGIGVAPLIVAGYNVAEKSVPPEKVTETLAWVIAGLSLGGALPGTFTGHIIDSQGASKAFVVPIACLVLANLATLPYLRTWRRISDH